MATINNVEELKSEARKTLQIVLSTHLKGGLTVSEFDHERGTVRALKLENFLHLAGFRTVRELYEKWFPDIVQYHGNMMTVNVDKLTGGQDNLKHIYELNLRTASTKNKKSGRRGRGGYQPQLSRQFQFRPTPVRPTPPPLRQQYQQPPPPEHFPQVHYDEYKPPREPAARNYGTAAPPGFDNQGFSRQREYVEPADYYPERKTYDYNLDDDDEGGSTYAQSIKSQDDKVQLGPLSEAELAFYDFVKAEEMVLKPKKVVIYGVQLKDEVANYATQIEKCELYEFYDHKLKYSSADRATYFTTVLSDLYDLLDVTPAPLYMILSALRFSLVNRPGYDHVDIYRLIQAFEGEFFGLQFSHVENLPTICVYRSEGRYFDEKCAELFATVPSNFEGSCQCIVYSSNDVDYPYYLCSGFNHRIAKELKSAPLTIPDFVYPLMLCVVRHNGVCYRAQVVTCEDFNFEGVLVELIDVGVMLRKPEEDIFNISRQLKEYPRCTSLAKLDSGSHGVELMKDEKDLFGRMSAGNVPVYIVENKPSHVVIRVK